MKRFTAITLAALMVLAVFASVMPASAVTVNEVKIRGPVLIGEGTMNPGNFAGFYYDFKKDRGNENITIKVTGASRTIDAHNLTYESTIISGVNFSITKLETTTLSEGNALSFEMVGYLADDYVPIKTGDASKLSKLLLDDKDAHTIRTGQAYELDEGYAVTAQQVDVEGKKVWLELTKDGEYVADKIIEVNSTSGADTNVWVYDQTVSGEADVVTLRLYIDQVFQGQVDSLAVIEGIWQISDSAIEITTDDVIGKFKVTDAGGSGTIKMDNENSFTLSKNSEVSITPDLSFVVADSDTRRFYLAKTYTAPGTYELRGTAITTNGSSVTPTVTPYQTYTWNAATFAGFFYDLKNDKKYETLNLTVKAGTALNADNRTIEKHKLVYNATIENVNFSITKLETTTLAEGNALDFQKIGYLAEEFVPIKENDAAKLSKLLLDDKDTHTIRTGQVYELGEGYAVTAQQVDVEGKKVWLELTKDGEYVADKIIEVSSTSGADTNVWVYDQTVSGEADVVTLRLYIDQVFQGQVDSLAVIEGIWQISDSVKEVTTDDVVGKLKVTSVGSSILMDNENAITLTKDTTIDIASGIKLKVADDTTLTRVYPFIEQTITGEPVEEEPVEVPEEEPVDEVPVDEVPVDEVPVDEVPVDEVPVDEVPVDEAPEEPVEPPEEEPGFEAIFAIAGLLAVAFLVRRNK